MKAEEIQEDEVDALFESDPQRTKPVIVRRAKKKSRKKAENRTFDVEVIKASVGVTPEGIDPPIRRVAAYCRVSTDQEAQSSSYELQCEYYTQYIGAKEGWLLAGIYADEGLSGTQMKKRDQLLKLIDDCNNGKIDMILTKSISRLSRNVVDCLTIIRELKALNPPVEVYFEKEHLSSLDDKTDMVLSMMASIAQEESRSISANISWAIRKRMENGTQKIPTACLLGYASDEDGNLVIVEEEAETVKYIYKCFIKGDHPNTIAERLNRKGSTTVLGNEWSGCSVRNILRNEKYCGDVLMQKTFTVDYLTHKTKKNEGERDQFYIADHHDAIVSREVWDKAQKILDKMNYKSWKQGAQQRLIPLEKGILKGFISINPAWKEVSVPRLIQATEKVQNTEKTRNAVAFSKGEGKQTYAITVKVPAIVVAIRKLLPDLSDSDSLTFRGKLFAEDKAIIYDITAGEPVKRRRKRKTDEETSGESGEQSGVDESPAEEPETAESETVEEQKTVVKKPRRGRPRKQQ